MNKKMRNVKRKSVILNYLAVILLLASVIYVGFNGQKNITGRATSGSTIINITVGANPTIVTVSTLPAQDVSEDTVKFLVFNFTASDADGVADLNPATAQVRINRTSETDRINASCVTSGSSFGNSQNFTCQIDLWYFDGAGDWTINATIQDDGGNSATNLSNTFTVNSLTAMTLFPNSLSWPTIAVTNTNTLSNNDPAVINNTGNADIASPNVQVTGVDLLGEQNPGDAIYAGNFTFDETDSCDSGPALVNGTATGITGAVLNAGNNSVNDGSTGQEQLYGCLEALNAGLSSQSYSTGQGGSWTIGIS
jgi:hypothetical protein